MKEPRSSVQSDPAFRASRRLAIAALLLWGLSLALPGFMVETEARARLGAEVLLLGLPFGWYVGGWAVYANVPFIVALIKLVHGEQPRLSVAAMLALAATLPLFSGVVLDEGAGHNILPVVGWGWGAIVWLFSVALLAVSAGVRAEVLSKAALIKLSGAAAAILAAIGFVHYQQWSVANLQERALFIHPGIAFTWVDPCDIPFVWPDKALLPPHSEVAVDIEASLKSVTNPSLSFPVGVHSVPKGEWANYRQHRDLVSVKISDVTPATRFHFEARKTDAGAILRLVDTKSGRALYEQALRKRMMSNQRAEYCPTSSHRWRGLSLGVDQAIARALGDLDGTSGKEQPGEAVQLHVESARERCDIGSEDLDDVKGLRSWDGKKVIVERFWRSRAGFCSASYIALIDLLSDGGAIEPNLMASAVIFDRASLRPLARFSNRVRCKSGGCKNTGSIIDNVFVENERLTLDIPTGAIVVARDFEYRAAERLTRNDVDPR